jgi:hypothetical protein
MQAVILNDFVSVSRKTDVSLPAATGPCRLV